MQNQRLIVTLLDWKMKNLDTRGLSCPEPVLRTQAALKNLAPGETLEVLVDSATPRDNVLRMARAKGCTAEFEEAGGEYKLILKK
jgi:TusA-related sulfurtransferase